MKNYKHQHLFISYILLCFLTTGHSCRAMATESPKEIKRFLSNEEMPAVLELIANQIRDNYERITTWSGEIDVELKILHSGAKAEDILQKLPGGQDDAPEPVLQKAKERVVFAVDVKKDAVYVDNFREKPCAFLGHITGRDLGSLSVPYLSGPYRSTLIGRPEYLLQADPQSFNTKNNTIRHSKAVKRLSQRESVTATGLYEGINDPRKTFIPGGIFTWDHHDRLIKEFDKSGKIEFDGYKFQIEEHKKGDVTEYIFIEPAIVSLERSDPSHYVIKTKAFSSQYGLNIISWKLTTGNGLLRQESSWEYELIDGVYLPKRVIEKYYNSDRDVYREIDSTYVNHKLNQEIPNETFEYTNLNLKDGDVFIDKIENKEYRYNLKNKSLERVKE